jgi:hypothetical protein
VTPERRAPGWHPDPAGRYEYRYWNGAAWTDDVSRAGITASDPLDEPSPPATAQPNSGTQAPDGSEADDAARAICPAGHENPLANKFCAECGAHIAHPAPPTPARAPATEATRPATPADALPPPVATPQAAGDDRTAGVASPWYRARWAIGAGLLVVLVATIAVAVALAGSGSDDSAARAGVAQGTRRTSTSSSTTTSTVPIAALQAEVNAEVQRACGAANSSGLPVTLIASYDERWTRVVPNAAALEALVTDCVNRAREAEIAAAGPIDVDAVLRNPDAVKGQVFKFVTNIIQFDAATGPCSFRGYWDNTDHEYSFDYQGDNAYFVSGDAAANCPVLAGIDQNDIVRVWAKGLGATTYSTTIGGATTVPKFDVLRAEIIRKA